MGKQNLFKTSRKIKQTGRVSDIDPLDDLLPGDKPAEQPGPEPRILDKSPAIQEPGKVEWVRKSNVWHPDTLKEFQDIIHTVKSSGQYGYSQKDALTDAVDLLKKKVIKEHGQILEAPN